MEYMTREGNSPFGEWFDNLKDKRAKAKIMTRLDRVSLGNFGDHKSITGAGTGGIAELREHSGPGYRIYYSIIENRIVLLLAGSSKSDQDRVITRAKKYLADYKMRKQYE